MDRSRFQMNDFLLVLILAAALYLFITVGLTKMADRWIYNETYELEDTGLYIRYTKLMKSGIFDGERTDSKLLLEGDFGHDWGAALEGDILYCNEYHETTMGFMTSDLVRIDLKTFTKEVLLTDTMLRGRCTSGELVCYEGVLMPNWFVDTNPLAKFYSLPSHKPGYEGSSAMVRLIDPQTGETLYQKFDESALTDAGAARYLNASAKEIMG